MNSHVSHALRRQQYNCIDLKWGRFAFAAIKHLRSETESW